MLRPPTVLRWLALAAAVVSTVRSCKIQGYDSGVCTIVDKSYKLANLPFCSKFVDYEVCLPDEDKVIKPDRNFPNGRWNNFTVRAKDEYLRRMITGNIHWRIDLETKWRLQEENELCENPPCNEWGQDAKDGEKGGFSTEIIPRFFQSPDCKRAYKAYACWLNFPRCDKFGNSLSMCKTACHNFFKSCMYEEELWRCDMQEQGIYQKAKEPLYDLNTGTNYANVSMIRPTYEDAEVDKTSGEASYLDQYKGLGVAKKSKISKSFKVEVGKAIARDDLEGYPVEEAHFFPGSPFAQSPCTGAAAGTRPFALMGALTVVALAWLSW